MIIDCCHDIQEGDDDDEDVMRPANAVINEEFCNKLMRLVPAIDKALPGKKECGHSVAHSQICALLYFLSTIFLHTFIFAFIQTHAYT